MGRAASAFIVFSLATVSCARAQQDNTGGMIASLNGGGIFGLGTHGSVGGSAAFLVSKYVVPFADFSYSPLTTYAFNYGTNNTGKALFTSGLLDANGGIRIRFPNSSYWAPYVGFGGGILHITSTTNMSGFNSTETLHNSRNDPAGNVSAGALYYVNQHVGLSIEIKGYLAQHEHFAQATAGLFFQIP